MVLLIGNKGNYVSSPLSVLVLLSAFLVSKGPKGETAKEICEAIVGHKERKTCQNLDYSNIELMIDRIRTAVESSRTQNGRTVFLSNAAFVQRGFPFREEFAQNFARYTGDYVEEVRFDLFPKQTHSRRPTGRRHLERLINGQTHPLTASSRNS